MSTRKHSQYAVKNVKSFTNFEGLGFNASLYENGKKVADVTDAADGGPMSFHWLDATAEQRMNDYCKTLPGYVSEALNATLPIDAEMVLSELVDEFEAEKKMKRLCKTQTLFSLVEDDENSYRYLKAPYDERAKKYLDLKYGNKIRVIYNELYK